MKIKLDKIIWSEKLREEEGKIYYGSTYMTLRPMKHTKTHFAFDNVSTADIEIMAQTHTDKGMLIKGIRSRAFVPYQNSEWRG